MSALPLSGLLVVSIEQAVAAPACTMRLADAGARVIKVERPEGDFARGYDRAVLGQSSYFIWLNRGKESIALDLRQESDRAVLTRLVARSDIFIQNLAPGAVGRLGFDSATLRARDEKLITVDISGYSSDGPYHARKAYDLLIQAESALAAVTGRPEGPGRVGISICDIATGFHAYEKVLEALIARGQRGRGCSIAVSMFDVMAEWMNVPYLQTVYGGKEPKRIGLAHPSIAPYGVFAAGDGEIVLAVQNEREWARLCSDIMGFPALADDERFSSNTARVAHRQELDRIIADWMAKQTVADVIAALNGGDIAFGVINSVNGLAQHPHLRRLHVETPSGPAVVIAPSGLTANADDVARKVPAIDEHGARIRAEFSP